MVVQKSIKLWFSAIFCFCIFSGTIASVFDVTLHYRDFQLDTLKQNNQKSQIFVENYGTAARDKLRQIFGDNQLDFDIYDIIESGDSEKTPLLTFRAILSASKLDDRDSFITKWESEDTSDFLLFSVGPSTASISENKLHDFHKKYTSLAQGECLNNGFMLPNNTCVCPPYFTQTDCSQMACLNSGIQATSFRCSCPPGYIGRYCEQMGCMAAFDSEFDFKKRSFVIVLNIIRDAAFMITTVQSSVNNLLQDRAGHYSNFILSTYYMNSQLTNYFSFTSVTDNFTIFQNQLSSVYANKDGQSKKQPTLGAINSAITGKPQISPKSDVYVFTLSPPSDFDSADPYTESSTTAESVLSRSVINWGHAIYTVLGQSSQSPFNASDSAIAAYKNIAAISNGEYIYVGNKTADAAKVFQSLFSINYLPQTIAARRGADCTTSITTAVTLGPYDSGIFIYTSGAGMTVSYNGAAITPTATYGDFQVFGQGANDTTANIIIGGGSSCSFRIFTSAQDSVVTGFAANTQIDISTSYPPAYITVYPVARIVSSAAPTFAQYSAISQMDGTVLFNGGDSDSTAGGRGDCNFPFQFSQWKCTERTFFSQITYTDNAIQTTRLIPSVCFTPVYRDPLGYPTTCNGGTVNRNNNTCSCPTYQDGQFCEKYLCQNGGTVNPFPMSGGSKCICQDGFTGNYCESLSCSSMSPRPDTSKKALNFVIQSGNSLSSIVTQIQAAAKSIAALPQDPTYFDNFVLTTFINKTFGDPVVTTNIYLNVTAFSAAIDNMPGGSSDLDQLQNPFTALLSTLNASAAHPWRQSLFLFVDSAPSDADMSDQVVSAAINLATSINVVLTLPFGADGVGQTDCVSDTSAYQKVADSTGGIFVNLCAKSDSTSVKSFTTILGQYHYNLETVSRESVACSSTVTRTIENNDGIGTRLIFLTFAGDYEFEVKLDNVPLSSDVVIPGVRIYKAPTPTMKTYSLTISPNGTMPSLSCSLVVGESTGQTILAGFTQNPSIDYSSFAAQYGTASYPTIFMSTQLQSPATVTLSFDNNGTTYTSVGVMRNASSCQFDYFFNDPFGCPMPGQTFTINARFNTSDGISFNRAIQSICQPPTPGTCLNGGYLNDGSPQCTCPPGFQGEFCEQRLCYNGGTFTQDMCKCPPNIGGGNCEYVLCDNWDYLETYDNNFVAYETIAFVVNTRLTSLAINMFLGEFITDFVNGVHNNGQAKQFILVTYDDQRVNKIISTTDETKFISVFQNVVTQNPTSMGINGTADVIGAVYETLRLITYKPAMLFLFSSGDVQNPANFGAVNNMLGKGGIQINIVLQSGQTVLPTTGKYYYYTQLAIASAGRIIQLTDSSNIQNLMQTALPSAIYEGIIVEDRTYASCATPQLTFFPVEYRSQWFSIFIRGDKANSQSSYVQIWDASDTIIDNPSDYLTLNDDGSMWYHFPSTITQNYAGYWKVQVETASKGCQVQIRANTPLQTSIGFSASQSTDFPYSRPFITSASNGTRYITASVSSDLYQKQDAFLEYVKISTFNGDNGTLTLVGGSALGPRDPAGCAYQFITSQIKLPTIGGSTAIQVQVNGQDERGNNFQQIHWYMNAPATCLNGATVDAYGLCVCQTTYTGDECETPICQNGGTADMVVCQCQSGYYGDFCQNALLSPNTTTTTSTSTTSGPTTSTPIPTTTSPIPSTSTIAPPPSTTTVNPPPSPGGDSSTTTTPNPNDQTTTSTPAIPLPTTSTNPPPSPGVDTPTPTAGPPPTPTPTNEQPIPTTTTPSDVTGIVTDAPQTTTSSNVPPQDTTTTPQIIVTDTPTGGNPVITSTPSSEITTTTISGSTTTRRGHSNESCPQESTMNIYLNYFFDVGGIGARYAAYSSILENTASQEPIGTPTRYLTIYAANGNGSHSNLTDITDIVSLKNDFAPFFSLNSENSSRVISDMTYYQSVLNTQLTYAATPVIVMFLYNPIDDVPTTTSKMNELKAANPSTYFMGVFLSTDPTFSQLPFDYSINITSSDNSAPTIAVAEIFKFVCQVTERTFIF